MSKSRVKLFLENMIFYGGLSMLTKALPLITLPIITRLLPDTSSYGIADMFNLIISFGTSLAVLGIYDAVFREFFEDKLNKEYQKKVTSTGFNIVVISSIIMFFVISISKKYISILLFNTAEYENLIILAGLGVVLSAFSSILASPTRMRNQRKIFFYTGIIFPLLGFLATYGFIKIGYTYEAIIFGTIVMNFVSVVVFGYLNRDDFDFKIYDKKVAKELFGIGIPLLPTFLIYWVFNSMDRIMISKMLGVSELGIYTVGSKIASVSQLIYTAFAGGWSYFAFSTMKDEDQVSLNSKVFEYLGIISFIAFIIAQPFIVPVFDVFFKGDYQKGAIVFSYLFLSPLILMLFQVVANQVIVIKKSYLSTIALIGGAIVNIILNYFLIEKYGIKGAAVSTLLSYVLSVSLMVFICYKYKLIVVAKRFIIIAIVLLSGIILDFLGYKNYFLFYVLILVMIGLAYLKDVKQLFRRGEKSV